MLPLWLEEISEIRWRSIGLAQETYRIATVSTKTDDDMRATRLELSGRIGIVVSFLDFPSLGPPFESRRGSMFGFSVPT